MFVLLNGQLLPMASATVPVSDRGLLYGDGLFETIRVQDGRVIEWASHWNRFSRGLKLLRLTLPCTADELLGQIARLLEANQLQTALVRLQLTRGPGPRGYSPRNAGPATLLLTTHDAPALPEDAPPQCRVITATTRLPADDPLTSVKSCNRLHYILARAEADDAGADEAILLNHLLNLSCASSANIFCLTGGLLLTPPVSAGALPGVTRGLVKKLAAKLSVTASDSDLLPRDLIQSEAVFLTQSSRGVIEVNEVNGKRIATSPLTTRLYRAWREHVISP